MITRRAITPLAGLTLFLSACGGAGAPDAAVPAPAPAPAAVFPAEAPEPMAPSDVEFPEYTERTLGNGAQLIVVENHEQPVVSVRLILPGGSAADPDGMAGLASVTASQIDKGTETMTALDIAEAADFIGASLAAGASSDWTAVYLTTLTDFLDEGLDLLSEVVLRPTFPESELETETQRRLSGLRLQRSQPGALAQEAFMERLYGEHPYGQTETVESIEAVDTDDLARFHAAHYRPEGALFVVAGDVDPDAIADRLEAAFDGWDGSASTAASPPAPPERARRTMVFVHKPGLVQAVVRMGHLFPSATGADWVAVDVANQVLGSPSAGFNAWMMETLRDEKGYTYGAYSSTAERPGPGFFVMSGEYRNEVADSALAIMIDLAERLRAGEIPDGDLEDAKLFLTGSFPLSIETPQQVAGQVASNRMLGRPDRYLEEYRTRVARVGKADAAGVAREHIRPDRSLIVVVGDAGQVLEKVRPFADEVEVIDAEGEPVDLEQLAARAAAASDLSFDASGLKPREMRYGIMFQGNEVGTVVTRWTREGEAFAVISEQTLPSMQVTQRTEFDALTFAPIRMVTTMGPMGEFALEVADGRATGTGFAPQQGPQDVDVEVQAGTFLEGQMDIAMAVHDFEDAGEFTMNTLTMAGAVESRTIRVTGEETVEVPAGTFETYRLDTGGQQAQTIWVTKSEPHVVVKVEPAGQPVQIVLKTM